MFSAKFFSSCPKIALGSAYAIGTLSLCSLTAKANNHRIMEILKNNPSSKIKWEVTPTRVGCISTPVAEDMGDISKKPAP